MRVQTKLYKVLQLIYNNVKIFLIASACSSDTLADIWTWHGYLSTLCINLFSTDCRQSHKFISIPCQQCIKLSVVISQFLLVNVPRGVSENCSLPPAEWHTGGQLQHKAGMSCCPHWSCSCCIFSHCPHWRWHKVRMLCCPHWRCTKYEWLAVLTGGGTKYEWLAVLTGGGTKYEWLAVLTGGGTKYEWLAVLTGGGTKYECIAVLTGGGTKYEWLAVRTGGGTK